MAQQTVSHPTLTASLILSLFYRSSRRRLKAIIAVLLQRLCYLVDVVDFEEVRVGFLLLCC
jgi:cytochrome c oxidase subunit IV